MYIRADEVRKIAKNEPILLLFVNLVMPLL